MATAATHFHRAFDGLNGKRVCSYLTPGGKRRMVKKLRLGHPDTGPYDYGDCERKVDGLAGSLMPPGPPVSPNRVSMAPDGKSATITFSSKHVGGVLRGDRWLFDKPF